MLTSPNFFLVAGALGMSAKREDDTWREVCCPPAKPVFEYVLA